MLEELLKDLEQLDLQNYGKMLFTLEEDEGIYIVVVEFDDGELIFGRDEKRYVLAGTDVDINTLLKKTGKKLQKYFKDNERFKHFYIIAYGCVDGNLFHLSYIRRWPPVYDVDIEGKSC